MTAKQCRVVFADAVRPPANATVDGERLRQEIDQFRRDVVGFDPEEAMVDPARMDDLVHHVYHDAGRDRETDADRASGAGEDRGVDSDQQPVAVDQRAAGIALVDCGVGLDEVLQRVDSKVRSPQRRHDAHRDRLPDVERIADCQHDVADPQRLGSPKRDGGQVLQVHLKNRQIGVGIGTDQVRRHAPAVGQRHRDLVAGLHDVVVGQDVAVRRGDNAGAQADDPLRLQAVGVAEKLA